MPTLTNVTASTFGSYTEDAANITGTSKIGFNYATLLTAANESADTDAFLLSGIVTGKLYVNVGSTAAPSYKQLVQTGTLTDAASQIAVDFTSAGAGGAGVMASINEYATVRLTGVFLGNTKISGSDSKIYWEPGLATNLNNTSNGGQINGFTIRSADNTNSVWGDGGDLKSGTNVNVGINVTAVNDAPTSTAATGLTAIEQTNFNLHGKGLVVDDVDLVGGLAGASVTVDLTVGVGALTVVVGTTGATLASGGVGGTTAQLTGTLAQVNAVLAGTGGSSVVYLNSSDAPAASTTLTVQIADNNAGAQGTGGALTGSATSTINITAVNDAPANTTPGAQSTGANVPLVFTGATALSVTDVDGPTAALTTIVSVGSGSLTVFAGNGGGVTGSGTNSVTITGTATEINAKLDQLTFNGTTSATLSMVTNDGGNIGTGGPISDTDFVDIAVVPVVTSVDEPVAGYYNSLEPLSYTVHYSSAVTVTGTPRIAVNVGGVTKYATYDSGTGTAELVFIYTVGAADEDPNGIAAAGPIDLNLGTIMLASDGVTAADLVLTGLDPTPAVIVDNTVLAPTALDLAAASDTGSNPADNLTKTTTPTITGSGETGATVTLFHDANDNGVKDGSETILGEATVTGTSWSITTTALTGSITPYPMAATQTDLAGNVSPVSARLNVTIDTTAPAVPAALDLDVLDDTGTSGTDNLTKNTTGLTISGTAAENGSVVTVFDDVDGSGTYTFAGDGATLGTGTVGGGNWTVDVSLAAGSHSLLAFATDAAGNVSAASTVALPITVDTTAPGAPAALDLDEGDDTGTSGTDNLTKNTTDLTISGTAAENGSVVTVFDDVNNDGAYVLADDGATLGTDIVADSAWSVNVALAEGLHRVRAFATDTAGNSATSAASLNVTVDTTFLTPSAPDLAAADDTGNNSDNVTSVTTGLSFSGTGEADATLTLFNDVNNDGLYVLADVLGTTTVAGGGAWTVDVDLPANASYVVRAIYTDKAGNVSAASTGLNVTLVTTDTTPPPAPAGLNLADADDTQGLSNSDDITTVDTGLNISGTAAENGSTVKVFDDVNNDGAYVEADDGLPLGSALVVGGIWDTDIDLAEGTHHLRAFAEDVAGNRSTISTPVLDVTVDTTAPALVYNGVSYDVGSHTLTISGTGFNGLGAATTTTDIKALIDATGLTWDVNGGGTDYTLATPDIASAFVTSDTTLVVTLNATLNVGNLEANPAFGGPAASALGTDTIGISATFVVSDVAGNGSTGTGATGLVVLGAQNEGAMPHTYSFSAGDVGGAVDETLGQAGTGTVDFATNFGGFTVQGMSAAQVSVDNSFGAGTYQLYESDGYGDDSTNNTVLLQGVADVAAEVVFADGSKVLESTGLSTTLSGTRFGDQLLAGANGDRLLGNAGNDLLVGGAGSDALYGGSGNDMLYGGGGSDYLSGGSGVDTFLYTLAADGEGHDVIATGFTAGNGGDVINVTGGASAAAMLALAVQAGADTLITFSGSETIRLLGVTADDLTVANFGVQTAFLKGGALI